MLVEAELIASAMCHRCIGASNKALARRRAAEDALRIIAQKEPVVAVAAFAKQAAKLQAALAVPGMEELAPVSSSASPPSAIHSSLAVIIVMRMSRL
jgi:hypothetical protein